MKIEDLLEVKLSDIRVSKANMNYIIQLGLTLEESFEYYKKYSIHEEQRHISKHYTFNDFIRHHRVYGKPLK